MKLKALKRFNYKNPGDVFDASAANAKKWIKDGLCEAADKACAGKEIDAPVEDKSAKGVKTK